MAKQSPPAKNQSVIFSKLVYSKGSITETGKKQERWKLIYGLKKSSLKALISSA